VSRQQSIISDQVRENKKSQLLLQSVNLPESYDFTRQCQSFSKFVNLTLEVFPLKVSAIDQVVRMIFSN
jgi:hypothetical protein